MHNKWSHIFTIQEDVFSVNDIGGSEEKIWVLQKGVQPKSPDDLPLSYSKLAGAETNSHSVTPLDWFFKSKILI